MKTTRLFRMVGAAIFASVAAGMALSQTAEKKPPELSGMALIPAGTNAGKTPDGIEYNLKVVTAFHMGQHEVTKALWDEVYAWAVKNGYGFDNAGTGKAPNHPVQFVDWYDSVKWCNARSEKEGRPVCYRVGGNVYRSGKSAGLEPDGKGLKCDFAVAGYRLPTDVEWEYAARGGLKGKRYPWGDTIDHEKANYFGFPTGYDYDKGYAGNDKRFAAEPQPFTAPVGSFPANGYGLHDMAGNVWEWTWDWSPMSPNAHRSIRGGAWSYAADWSRSASRSDMYPEFSYWSVGFRTVLTSDK